MGEYLSWGVYGDRCDLDEFYWEAELRSMLDKENPALVVGRRRSYGDVCLNTQGRNITSTRYDRFIDFNQTTGEIECCSGLGLDVLNSITIPKGWFVPVSPGTMNVTVGGMIANDVHGKNHHNAGSFGNHILSLDLLHHGQTVKCTTSKNSELFYATIGGMGLTGAITHCRFKLKSVRSSVLYVEDLPLTSLNDFQQLSKDSDHQWEYTVAWLDADSVENNSIRGVYSRGKHIEREANHLGKSSVRQLSIPVVAPNITLNRFGMRAFNSFYYSLNKTNKESVKSINSFFYPLDKLSHWNRLYGQRGFFQYQCVLPLTNSIDVILQMLQMAKMQQHSPYLTVLKKFGEILPVGMMSFPMPGYTIAMDFPNLGQKTLSLFEEFDNLVTQYKGRLYAAKDGRMSAQTYQRMYPNFHHFIKYRDPAINSDFWRRVSRV